MTPEELEILKQTLHALKEAGGTDSSFILVGSLLILVAVLSFRLFVVNGIVKKIFDYQEKRNGLLTNILSELSIIKTGIGDRRRKS